MLIELELPVYSYGILVALAFILGLYLYQLSSKYEKEPLPGVVSLLLLLSCSGIVGARIAYILLFPWQFSSLKDCFAIHEGGLVFYGGFLGALLVSWIYCKAKGFNFSAFADNTVPSLALGHAIGRLGCLINSCCYGKQSSFLKIYRIPGDPEGIYRHPTQLYCSLFLLGLFVFLRHLLRSEKIRTSHGVTASIYLIFYSVFRFFIEFLRDDDRGQLNLPFDFSISQIISALLFTVAVLWFLRVVFSFSEKE